MAGMIRALQHHLREQLAGRPSTVPAGGVLIWRWFQDLCRTRQLGMGPSHLTYAEIDAYARLYRWPLEPRHVDMILKLDSVWMEWARTAGTPSGEAKAAPSTSSQPMTPAAFDAVFS